MASAWASAVLIILAHRLLADGFHLVSSRFLEPHSLALILIVAALAVGSLVLHRKPKMTAILDDFLELLRKLQDTPQGLRTDPSIQDVAGRIKKSLGQFGRYNVDLNQCAKFFDDFVDTLQRDPDKADASAECPLVEMIEQSFKRAKDCQVATYSMGKTKSVERAKEFTFTLSVEDEGGQRMSPWQAASLTASWNPAILSFAFHELSRICIVRGDKSVHIALIPELSNDPSKFRVRYTTPSRRPLPPLDELRSGFFAPLKQGGGSLGCFLVRHLFRNCCRGDLEIVDAEVTRGNLSLDLTVPREFSPDGELTVSKSGDQKRSAVRA